MPVPVTDPRRCSDCEEWKPLTAFYVKSSNYGRKRYDTSCKVCRGRRTKEYQNRPENVPKVLAYKQKWYERVGRFATRVKAWRAFNGTIAAYDVQLLSQSGRCAICLRLPSADEMRFAFDHDHETGLACGVLCRACNAGLGAFYDQPKFLLAAIRYLEHWSAQHDTADGTNGL